jgi:hypothetical protein
LDNFTIDVFGTLPAPVITLADAQTVGISTALDDDQELTPADGSDTIKFSDIKGETLTTLCIKVTNVVNDVMPVVEVNGTKYEPTYKYDINANGYFVYQFVDIDITDATVSYEGAVSVNNSAE